MVATAAPPEPAVQIGSPRTRAAMQILGILPRDFRQKDRGDFKEEGIAGDVRHEVFEIKRRQLMHNVKKLARDTAPPESEGRVDPADGKTYTYEELHAHYAKTRTKTKQEIEELWRTMPPAPRRIDPVDGKPYTYEELHAHYAKLKTKSKADIDEYWRTMPPAGTPKEVGDATNKFLADVLEKETKSLEKMRKRAQGDVQSIVIKEMEVKRAIQAAKEKEDANEKRRKELQKQRDKVLEEQKKELQKKYERAATTRRRAVESLEEHANQLEEELEKKNERVENLLQEREGGWEENRVTKQAEREQKYREIAKHEGRRRGKCENLYASVLKRTARSESHLANVLAKQQAFYAAKSDRTDMVIATTQGYQREKQAAREESYMKRLVEHEKAEDVREREYTGTIKKFKKKNEDERKNWEKGIFRAKQEEKELHEHALEQMKFWVWNEDHQKLTRQDKKDYSAYPAWQTSASIKHFETHKSMGDLRNQVNLGILQRQHQYAQKQALAKIDDMRYRVAALQDSKDQAQQRRYDVMKNCALEKHHLAFQVEKVRDAPPERMNGLLKHMGLPPVTLPGDEKVEEENAGKT